MTRKNLLALIPARSGSKGIKHKNVRMLGNHPLLAYSVALAKVCGPIDRVIVSTDSVAYAEVAKKYGAEVPFLRPPEISLDESRDDEFFQHAYGWLQKNEGYVPDLVLHFRPTTPFRQPSIVRAAIDAILADEQATSLRSVYETHLTPYKMFKNSDGYLSPFLDREGESEFYNLPRQHFEKAFIPNGYVDILKPEILLETGMLHGVKIKFWEAPNVPDIDTDEEFRSAERLLNSPLYQEVVAYLNSKI